MAPVTVHAAAEKNDVEALRTWLDSAPWDLEDTYDDYYGHRTPLHVACEAGSLGAARLLLDRGANMYTRDEYRFTPLMRACHAGRAEIVSLLLARGASPMAYTALGVTALMLAADGDEKPDSDHVAVIRLLLKDGRLPVDARQHTGATALWLACNKGRVERARVLLVDGLADPAGSGYSSTTATSGRRRHQSCARLLEWYEGELEKRFLLSKARAVLAYTEKIAKAPEKARAQTEAQAQKAREEAAPAYLKDRVRKGKALPALRVVGQSRTQADEDEEHRAVSEFVFRLLTEDLFIELKEGLRYR